MTTVSRDTLDRALRELLQPELFRDYVPNGLQVEGRETIRRVVTGVSANQALIDAALAARADAIVVHHGFFWKSEPRQLTGIRARRVGALLRAEVSLFGYHLPLDAHADVGNNVGLLRAIEAEPSATFDAGAEVEGRIGTYGAPEPLDAVVARVEAVCGQPARVFPHGPPVVRRVGVCTGGGADFFEAAVTAGADAFVTGEAAEWSAGLARELGATFIAAGHHATERFGPRLLGEWIRGQLGLDVEFIDVPNPV